MTGVPDGQLILVIDDDPAARELARDSLAGLGSEIMEAGDGVDGLLAARRHQPDLVLLDVNMPGLDGWATCRRLKSLPRGRLTPVVLLTALDDVTARVTGLAAGADDIMAKPFIVAELRERVRSLLETSSFYRTLDELDSFLFALVRSLEARHQTARRHSTQVAELTMALGSLFGFTGQALDDLFRAGLVHDIGKIGIPDAILNKPGPLTEAERTLMQAHVSIGAELVAPLARSASLVPAIRHHHEWWDGSGYAEGLAGEAIPLAARIVAVCDCWDAMISERPYRAALTPQEAASELRAGAGSQWDPDVVGVFLDNVFNPFAHRSEVNWALPALALGGR